MKSPKNLNERRILCNALRTKYRKNCINILVSARNAVTLHQMVVKPYSFFGFRF